MYKHNPIRTSTCTCFHATQTLLGHGPIGNLYLGCQCYKENELLRRIFSTIIVSRIIIYSKGMYGLEFM